VKHSVQRRMLHLWLINVPAIGDDDDNDDDVDNDDNDNDLTWPALSWAKGTNAR